MLTHQNSTIFARHVSLYPHESGCQGKTFLCAVATQMFHKVVPSKSEVRGQPAGPYQAPLLSLAWMWAGTAKQVARRLSASKGASGTSHPPCGTFQWAEPCRSLRGESLGLSKLPFPFLCPVLSELRRAQCPERQLRREKTVITQPLKEGYCACGSSNSHYLLSTRRASEWRRPSFHSTTVFPNGHRLCGEHAESQSREAVCPGHTVGKRGD